MEQARARNGGPRSLAPHFYSGLETDGMKLMHCTLKLQPEWAYATNVICLAPRRISIPRDGQPHGTVMFRGCKIIQLRLGFRNAAGPEETVMPTTLTVGGPCKYTKEDKRDFEIMMRTQQQSRIMHLPPNGEFDWPDYRAFETCPFCCRRAKPGSDDRYWLLFQPLIQNFENDYQRGFTNRFINRLTCEECFDSVTDGQVVQVKVHTGAPGYVDVPVLDVVEQQGPITWMQDGQMSMRGPRGVYLDAYKLYGVWENSGAWQAMNDLFMTEFQEVIGIEGVQRMPGMQDTEDPSKFWEMSQIPVKEGRVCDAPDCTRVHGNREAPEPGKKKGKKIRLQECTGCYEAMFCCEDCQHAAWPGHKESCKEIRRKRKKEEDEKKEQQRMEDEAKMEAVRASFVPLSITPQAAGGGSKKKKGGGKKKNGKKK